MTLFKPESFSVPLDAEQAAHQALVKLEQEQLRDSSAPENLTRSSHHPSEAELYDIFVSTPNGMLEDDDRIAYLTEIARKAASDVRASINEILDRVTSRPDEAA